MNFIEARIRILEHKRDMLREAIVAKEYEYVDHLVETTKRPMWALATLVELYTPCMDGNIDKLLSVPENVTDYACYHAIDGGLLDLFKKLASNLPADHRYRVTRKILSMDINAAREYYKSGKARRDMTFSIENCYHSLTDMSEYVTFIKDMGWDVTPMEDLWVDYLAMCPVGRSTNGPVLGLKKKEQKFDVPTDMLENLGWDLDVPTHDDE